MQLIAPPGAPLAVLLFGTGSEAGLLWVILALGSALVLVPLGIALGWLYGRPKRTRAAVRYGPLWGGVVAATGIVIALQYVFPIPNIVGGLIVLVLPAAVLGGLVGALQKPPP